MFVFMTPITNLTHLNSAIEERAAYWVWFGEHDGDAITHKLLDTKPRKIIYRSAVNSSASVHPNKHLASDGG